MSNIKTTLRPDSPLALTADYQINSKADRRLIDDQNLATQELVTQQLLRGQIGTWFKAAVTLAVGDVICASPSAADEGNGLDVVRSCALAATAALTSAGSALGVVVAGGVAGAWVRAAMFGVIGNSVTGLGALGGFARVSSVGRCEYVATYTAGDYPIGSVDGAGNLTVQAGRAFSTTVAIGASAVLAPALVATTNIALTGVVTVDGVASNTVTGDVLATAQTVASDNGYWTTSPTGVWVRPSYYNSDAGVAALRGQLSGAALNGTSNKGKQFYAATGTTISGAKAWLPGKAPAVINANEAPWFLKGDSSDETAGLAAIFAYANVSGAGATIEFGPGVTGRYLTAAPIVKGRYISVRGPGRLSADIGTYGTAPIDTFKLSEQLNVGGGDHATFKHIKISNSFGGYQPPVRANITAYTVGTRVRCPNPGLTLLQCTVAGTTGAHPPIGELFHAPYYMLLTGTANADKQPVMVVRTGGYFGTMTYQLSVDNCATLGGTVYTTSLTNSDGTYRDYETATFPSSGTLGIKLPSVSAIASAIYDANTLTASYTQPAVGANVQLTVATGAGMSRLMGTGFVYVNGGGLYSLVSVDSYSLATVKLVTAVASPGATVAASWAGQAWYPAPRVEVIGTPAADNWALDVFHSNSIGKLGVATFRYGSAAIVPEDRGKAQYMALLAPTITPTAGAYSDYADAVSGCTIRFHTGVYTPNGSFNYITPESVCSMIVGSTIVDGGVTWTVIEGPEPIRSNGRGFLTLDDVWLEGGMTGIFMSQSESVSIHDTVFNGQLSAGGFGSSGQGRLGEYGGFTNGITYSGNCAWYTLGFGPVHDGASSLKIEGSCLFQSCPSGFMRLSLITGGHASGFYAESSGPALVRNCFAFCRQPTSFGLWGFSFTGFFTGGISGPYSFDMYYSDGVSWTGGYLGGTSYGIKNAVYLSNGHIEGCKTASAAPLTDAPFASGRIVSQSVETNSVVQNDYPNAQTLANGVNDLAAPSVSDIDISGPSAAFSIRSAPAVAAGQRATYRYFGTQPLTLSHEVAAATAATRLMCPNARDIVIPAAPSGGYVEFTLRYRAGSINRHVVETVTPVRPTNNLQTGTTYTAVLGDAEKCVDLSNASAVTWTIPPAASVAYLPGTVLTAAQLGAGQVTATPGAGVTIQYPNGKASAKTASQYAHISVRLTDTADTWIALGNLA